MEYVKLLRKNDEHHKHLYHTEKLACRYFQQYPSEFIIPIIKVEETRIVTAMGFSQLAPIYESLIGWLWALRSWLYNNEWSHNDLGWQSFTSKVIDLLYEDNRPKVFIAWGSEAGKALGSIVTSPCSPTSSEPSFTTAPA